MQRENNLESTSPDSITTVTSTVVIVSGVFWRTQNKELGEQ